MSLVTALIVKNSHIDAGIYFIFLKNVLKPKSQYQILTSVKRSQNQLRSKVNFSTFCNLIASILD